MVSIASRSSWGARRPNGDRNLSGLGRDVVLHHTVTTHLSPNATVSQERAQMRSLESIGHSRFGSGISYNVIIFPSGRAYQGVSFHRRGTHTGGHNSTVRSICFAGNYEKNEPTKAQIETAAAIVAEGRGKWWRSNARVQGHRDYSSTACPGKNVYAKRGQIASGKVTGGSGGGGDRSYESATAKHAVGSRTMGLFDGGTDVRWLQEKLLELGYSLPNGGADGLYGKSTETAVRNYQRDRGLSMIDGLAGDETISAIKSKKGKAETPSVPGTVIPFPYEKGGYIGPRSGPNRSHSGIGGRSTNGRPDREWNKEWVRQLVRRGWNARKGGTYLTKYGNDGKYGSEFAALVEAFQKDRGLAVDGLVGKDTWDAAFKNPVT